MLVDPDAPTPEDPKYAFWRHWIQGGLEPGVWPPAHQAAVTSYLAPGPKDELSSLPLTLPFPSFFPSSFLPPSTLSLLPCPIQGMAIRVD